MKVSVIDPCRDERWDKFVITHKYGSVFHLSGWCSILRNTFAYEPNYLIVEDNKGNIRAGLPLMFIKSWITGRRFVSLPRIPYANPLAENEENLQALLKHAVGMVEAKGAKYVEIKTQDNNECFANSGFKNYVFFLNHTLDLVNGLEKLWTNFHRSCIKQPIKRAEKSQAMFRFGENEEDLRTFYFLYKKMAQRHMIPPRPFKYFFNIWNTFGQKRMAEILIAEVDGRPGAACLNFVFNKRMHIEYLGLDYDLSTSGLGQFLFWQAIKTAHEKKISTIDFGLTPVSDSGLIEYKRRWGTKESSLNYFYYPDFGGYKKYADQGENVHNDRNIIESLKKRLKSLGARFLYKHFG